MDLHETLSSINIDPHYAQYIQKNSKYSLELNELSLNIQNGLYNHNNIDSNINDQFKKITKGLVPNIRDDVSNIINSNAALVLQYRGKDTSIMNINEYGNKELWNILHVGGAKSNQSYRVCSGLKYIDLFADLVKVYAEHPESDVKYITMPRLENIPHLKDIYEETIVHRQIMDDNIYLSKRNKYTQFISRLGLRYSHELDCNILEIKKNITS